MKTDLNDTTPDNINPQQEGTEGVDIAEDGEIRKAFQLEEALKKERQQAKQAAKKAAELEAELKRIKEQYDPDRLKTLEERELIRQQQFEKLAETKARELEETRNQATTYQKQLTELQIQTAVTTAFYKAGGRDEMLNPADPDLDDVSPSETVLKLLRDRIQVQDGKVVILDKYGQVEMINNRPKTLLEEMQKLRKGSLSGLFYAENTNEGMGTIQSVNANGKVVPAYSREQARMGKASIEDIAKGKAIIR